MTSGYRLSARIQREYTPVHWLDYFDEAHDVEIENEANIKKVGDSNNLDSFRVYLKNFREPYAPKRQAGKRIDDLNKPEQTTSEMERYSQVPTLVALHGGGYSALTWAQFSAFITDHCHCRILAIDLRGHGDSRTKMDDQMSIETLVSDVVSITHHVHKQICGFVETPKLVLIGHSMGGAIAVKCAASCSESLSSLAGIVVIDVVEGTAKDALPLMMSVIQTRPSKFPSLENAIEWTVKSGMAKNIDAARVSMPGNLINLTTKQLAIHDVKPTTELEDDQITHLKRHKFQIDPEQLLGPGPPPALLSSRLPLHSRVANLKGCSKAMLPPPVPPISRERPTISEEEPATLLNDKSESNDTDQSRRQIPKSDKSDSEIKGDGYIWRTNLAKTQPYWIGWFDGLSTQLLEAPVQGKFLLLAGIDRLDKTLTIGQMQGKFMMKVLPKCGHAVHEDVPEQVVMAIGDFLVRNKFAKVVT